MYFSLLLLLLLFTIIAKCDDKNDWWKTTVIYEIYPDSFKDSNGDGIGDIKGITSKLDYIKSLGVEAIRIVKLYPSYGSKCDEYGILNHKAINSTYGTMEDMDELITQLNERDMKLIIDFVPNHTSREHIWFLKSLASEGKYADYYVWKTPKNVSGRFTAPNNWKDSLMVDSAWEYDEGRKQYNYHSASSETADLDLRNPLVVKEMKDVIQFWLDKGVHGFYLKNPFNLIEDELFRDEKKRYYWFENNVELIYCKYRPESYELIYEFRKFIDEYSKKDGFTRILLADTFSENINRSIELYGSENRDILHFPLDIDILTRFTSYFPTAAQFVAMANKLLEKLPQGRVPVWATETSYRVRIPKTFDDQFIDIENAFPLVLPGVTSTLYGQEYGLRGFKSSNWFNPIDQKMYWMIFWNGLYLDDQCPMQWDFTANAGFTTSNKPWMGVTTNYWKFNIETQMKNEKSHLNFYRKLMNLRKSETFKYGDVKIDVVSEHVFAITRSYTGHKTYVIFFNLGTKTYSADLKSIIPTQIESLVTDFGSSNAIQNSGDIHERGENGTLSITFRPKSVIVLTTSNSKGIWEFKDTMNDNSKLNIIAGAAGICILVLGLFVHQSLS